MLDILILTLLFVGCGLTGYLMGTNFHRILRWCKHE